MPHFVIDCSANILINRSEEAIVNEIHDTADATGLFEKGDIKVRMNPFKVFTVGGSKTDFIHVFAHVMEGRTSEQKANLSAVIVQKLKDLFPEVSYIAMNVSDFEKATYCNLNTLKLDIALK